MELFRTSLGRAEVFKHGRRQEDGTLADVVYFGIIYFEEDPGGDKACLHTRKFQTQRECEDNLYALGSRLGISL